MVRRVKQLTEREELLVAYGHIISARAIQVNGLGLLWLALNRLPVAQRGDLYALANAADEAMKQLRLALAKKLGI